MTEQPQQLVREVVAIVHDEASMDAAIDDLEEHGFDRAEISLMASEHAVEQKLGSRYHRIQDAADDPATPRVPLVAPEDVGAGEGALIGGLAYVGAMAATGAVVASGGALLAAGIAAVAGGIGAGAIGGLLARWLGHHHAHEIEEHLKRGGLLLWVNLRDRAHEEAAKRILARHTKEPVRVHEIAAADPTAGPGPNLEPYPVGIPYLFRLKQ